MFNNCAIFLETIRNRFLVQIVKKNKSKKNGEEFGISGFTLGIISIAALIFAPFFGLILSIVGFSLSLSQQKRKQTKFGKRGIILNVIGFVLNIVWWIVLLKYLIPIIQ